MQVNQDHLAEYNRGLVERHQRQYEFLSDQCPHAEDIVRKLLRFQIAIPSWALGTGGTRFGRFPGGGEPRNLEEKLLDVGLLHALTRSAGAISLHIPWDIPADPPACLQLATRLGLRFDAMNSNSFQDQPGQELSYKFGSLQHVDPAVRRQCIDHNLEVIRYGRVLGSRSLTVWLSDGSCFPGQLNFAQAFRHSLDGLAEIYSALPADWKLFVEYKAYEPNFYSMTVGDWGQALLYASKLGSRAAVLVDLGHHLPSANIEQIVALLLMEGRLGGFHFNDSKYGDDDLTAGSIKPYQLFLIFCELVEGMDARGMDHASDLAWMIDASHNLKDPLEDLLQSLEAIRIAYAQALLVDRTALAEARLKNDPVRCQEILQEAFRGDCRPLLAEARLRAGGAIDPLGYFRRAGLRESLVRERGFLAKASGL
jgi:L-rhamnose isomerase/sugar isomerase